MTVRLSLALYIAMLAVIGFYPTPVDRPVDAALFRVIAWSARHGLAFVTYARIETDANILLFVPFGLLLTLMLKPQHWWWAPVICLAASTVVELGQGILLPHRFSSLADVLANTVGGIIGTAVALGISPSHRIGGREGLNQ